jgi:hypothetical protein
VRGGQKARFQCADPLLERLVALFESKNLRLDALARRGADDLVTPGPRRFQLAGNARAVAAQHEDLVLDEPLELTDGLLEVLLFACSTAR